MAKPIPYNTHYREPIGQVDYRIPRRPPIIYVQEMPRQNVFPVEPPPALDNRHFTPEPPPPLHIPERTVLQPNLPVSHVQAGPLGWFFRSIPPFWRILLAALSGCVGCVPVVLLLMPGIDVSAPLCLAGILLVGSVFYLGAVTHGLCTIETDPGNIQLLGIVVLSSGGMVLSALCLPVLACALVVGALYLGMGLVIFCVDTCFALFGLH